jgi:uncharacterized RDD family membrane protein YckC
MPLAAIAERRPGRSPAGCRVAWLALVERESLVPRRALAVLVDLGASAALAATLVVAGELLLGGSAGAASAVTGGLVLTVAVLAPIALLVAAEWRRGATPGKQLLGLRVEATAGGPMSLGATLARQALRISPVLWGAQLSAVLAGGDGDLPYARWTATRVVRTGRPDAPAGVTPFPGGQRVAGRTRRGHPASANPGLDQPRATRSSGGQRVADRSDRPGEAWSPGGYASAARSAAGSNRYAPASDARRRDASAAGHPGTASGQPGMAHPGSGQLADRPAGSARRAKPATNASPTARSAPHHRRPTFTRRRDGAQHAAPASAPPTQRPAPGGTPGTGHHPGCRCEQVRRLEGDAAASYAIGHLVALARYPHHGRASLFCPHTRTAWLAHEDLGRAEPGAAHDPTWFTLHRVAQLPPDVPRN